MAKKILIAEDEKDIVLVLKSALERNGYEVSVAFNGLEALEEVARSIPDLLVLDIMMPRMDGHAVNLKLKENPKTARIPVIIITGRGQLKELIDIYDKVSVADYFEKPFMVSALLDKIKSILES